MKVSRAWLQKYFDQELPSVAELSDALTFHAFEIEETTDDMLDVNVLADRACYGLSHRGIAKEISAVLGIPLKYDPLRTELPTWQETEELTVTMDEEYCPRHVAALVRGVKVGPSPEWLRTALAAVGQRSINNIVDASNYVMLDIGQPTHAFDARTLARSANGSVGLVIRSAKEGEKITVLTGDEYTLSNSMYVIADATSDAPLDIAGLKGGLSSGTTDNTTDLLISVGNYDPSKMRRMSQRLKLFTDAGARYQNRVSPELTAYGMRDFLALIQEVAGGELVGVVDVRAQRHVDKLSPVSVTLTQLNDRLGSTFDASEVGSVFDRLDLSFVEEGETFVVTPPFERRDIQIPEDLSEEVGRVLGYDRVPPKKLPPAVVAPDQRQYRGIERLKDVLIERGFTEISTQSFAAAGEVQLANPLQNEKPYLRPNLAGNMREALARGVNVAPRVLGPAPALKLFEVGMIFTSNGEMLSLALGYAPLTGKKQPVLAEVTDALSDLLGRPLPSDDTVIEVALGAHELERLGEDYELRKVALERFRPFSVYPFALRDIAVWTPSGTEESEVTDIILKEAGELLARIDLFDRFEKDGRISYAFRLVFESFERTLSDADLNPAMNKVTSALNAREGWEVR